MKKHTDNPADKVLLCLLSELRFEKTMRGTERQRDVWGERSSWRPISLTPVRCLHINKPHCRLNTNNPVCEEVMAVLHRNTRVSYHL